MFDRPLDLLATFEEFGMRWFEGCLAVAGWMIGRLEELRMLGVEEMVQAVERVTKYLWVAIETVGMLNCRDLAEVVRRDQETPRAE